MSGLNLKCIIKGLLFTIIMIVLFLILITVISYFTDVNDNMVNILIFSGIGLGVFAGAFAASKASESHGAVYGIAIGILSFMLFLLFSITANGRLCFNSHIASVLAVCVCSGFLGGILGK